VNLFFRIPDSDLKPIHHIKKHFQKILFIAL